MSYCRWSSDDFASDVYCYEHVDGGFMIHVAGNRCVFKGSLPPRVDFSPDNVEAFVAREKEMRRMLEDAEHVPIDLPHVGETFTENTAKACADRLQWLREIGYVVPQYAIDALIEESKEAQE